MAPGIKPLNKSYGNLLTASTAIERRVAVEARQSTFSTLSKLIGAAAADALSHGDIKGAASELAVAAANTIFGSTAVKTRIAAGLNLLGSKYPEMLTGLLNENPTLKGVITKFGSALGTGARYVTNRAGARVGSKF